MAVTAVGVWVLPIFGQVPEPTLFLGANLTGPAILAYLNDFHFTKCKDITFKDQWFFM